MKSKCCNNKNVAHDPQASSLARSGNFLEYLKFSAISEQTKKAIFYFLFFPLGIIAIANKNSWFSSKKENRFELMN